MGKGTNHLDRIRVNFDSNGNFTSAVDKTKQTMKPEDFPLLNFKFPVRIKVLQCHYLLLPVETSLCVHEKTVMIFIQIICLFVFCRGHGPPEGQGLIAFDPTFGSFALLKLV
jgi:hypothetical protein